VKRKQFLVIGLGRFGSGVARTLHELGHEVVAIDTRDAPVQEILGNVTQAAIADATDETVLRDLGISSFDAVIVAIGNNIEANIYTTLAAKDAGAKYIVCKAVDEISKRILLKIGADKVIRPENDSGVRLARSLASPKLLGSIELTADYNVMELEATLSIAGKLERVEHHGVKIIAYARGEVVIADAPEQILIGDKLVVLGRIVALEKLRQSVSD
jgi:trk system potassium uptake protein